MTINELYEWAGKFGYGNYKIVVRRQSDGIYMKPSKGFLVTDGDKTVEIILEEAESDYFESDA